MRAFGRLAGLARPPCGTRGLASDASLIRRLLRELHPDRVHGDAAAERANAAAFAAVSSYADAGPSNGGGAHPHTPVRITAYFRGRDHALRRVDAALPPRGAAPPRVALRPLLVAAGLEEEVEAGPSSRSRVTHPENPAEVAAALAERDASAFLIRAHTLAAARRARSSARSPPAEAAAIRAVHGVALGFVGVQDRAGAAARAVAALAGVPPGALRGGRLTLTGDATQSYFTEAGVVLALSDSDAVWQGVITRAVAPTGTDATPAWRAAAAHAAELRELEDAAALALSVGAVAAERALRADDRYRSALARLAAGPTPPPDPSWPRVAVRFVVAPPSSPSPPAGVVEVGIDAPPAGIAATVAAAAPAAAAAAAAADRAAAAADALLTDLSARLGAATVTAAPGAPPPTVARAAAALIRAAPAIRRGVGGAWGRECAVRVGGGCHVIGEDGREVVVGGSLDE